MKKKIYSILLAIIIILALAIRTVYITKMPYTAMQHDIEPNGNGLEYIFTIYEKGTLPQSNGGQFYHPPLHHIISAGWLKVIDGFYEEPSHDNLAEGLQYLTLIYSMLIIYVAYKILGELKFSKKTKLLLTVIVAFHPALVILSGRLNNDQLCLLLILWTILRLIKWNKKSNVKNTVILAITTGLSVMTKMVGAVVAFPIIIVFLIKLYRELGKSKDKTKTLLKYIGMYTLFGLISLPIGLWYPIRNYILFGQGLLYIPNPGNPNPTNALYVGHISLLKRLSLFSPEIFQKYCQPFGDYNMITYLLKCSIFGEFNWGVTNIVYDISMILNIILILFTLYCIIKNLIIKDKRNKLWKITLFLTWLAIFISYIKVNIEMPFGCTMDFRYMYLNLIIGLLFIGFEFSGLERKHKVISKYVYALLVVMSFILMLCTNYIIFRWKV